MGTPNIREIFERRVRQHDLTYAYSDDPRSYRNGGESLSIIKTLAKEINDPEYTNKVWNDNVNRFLAEGFREPFYWK
jgi:hypothetical protein